MSSTINRPKDNRIVFSQLAKDLEVILYEAGSIQFKIYNGDTVKAIAFRPTGNKIEFAESTDGGATFTSKWVWS